MIQLLALAKVNMMVTLNKVFSDFEEKYDYYKKIVNELVNESKLLILIDTKRKLVVSKPPNEGIF